MSSRKVILVLFIAGALTYNPATLFMRTQAYGENRMFYSRKFGIRPSQDSWVLPTGIVHGKLLLGWGLCM